MFERAKNAELDKLIKFEEEKKAATASKKAKKKKRPKKQQPAIQQITPAAPV